jgi:predicted aconitase with swiveling domain
VTAKVLVMPRGRGSSSSSSTLAEALLRRTAPAAILLAEADSIIALGCLVFQELYGESAPVVVVPRDSYERIATGSEVSISATRGGPSLVRLIGPD